MKVLSCHRIRKQDSIVRNSEQYVCRNTKGGMGMRNKTKWIVTSGLCIAFILGNCLAVSANMKNKNITMEYAEFADIQESVQSESGDTVVLTYVEKAGSIYLAVYQDGDAMGDPDDPDAASPAAVTIEKTVVKTYASFEDIPTSVYYTEYTFDMWYSGNLSLEMAEKAGSIWHATYSGDLTGDI